MLILKATYNNLFDTADNHLAGIAVRPRSHPTKMARDRPFSHKLSLVLYSHPSSPAQLYGHAVHKHAAVRNRGCSRCSLACSAEPKLGVRTYGVTPN